MDYNWYRYMNSKPNFFRSYFYNRRRDNNSFEIDELVEFILWTTD